MGKSEKSELVQASRVELPTGEGESLADSLGLVPVHQRTALEMLIAGKSIADIRRAVAVVVAPSNHGSYGIGIWRGSLIGDITLDGFARGILFFYEKPNSSSQVHPILNFLFAHVGNEQVIGLPLWLLAILIGYLGLRILRGEWEPLPGVCVKCGYDLRATPERCPECGTENARRSAGVEGL